MKSIVLEKTRYLITNSWLGLLLPAGVHQLLRPTEKTEERQPAAFRNHPAESRISRSPGSAVRP